MAWRRNHPSLNPSSIRNLSQIVRLLTVNAHSVNAPSLVASYFQEKQQQIFPSLFNTEVKSSRTHSSSLCSMSWGNGMIVKNCCRMLWIVSFPSFPSFPHPYPHPITLPLERTGLVQDDRAPSRSRGRCCVPGDAGAGDKKTPALEMNSWSTKKYVKLYRHYTYTDTLDVVEKLL